MEMNVRFFMALLLWVVHPFPDEVIVDSEIVSVEHPFPDDEVADPLL
jgi:hypothetical protein